MLKTTIRLAQQLAKMCQAIAWVSGPPMRATIQP